MTQSNYISTIWFFFSIHWFWACWKATTLYNTLKKESTNKNHSDDNYSALIRFWILLTFLFPKKFHRSSHSLFFFCDPTLPSRHVAAWYLSKTCRTVQKNVRACGCPVSLAWYHAWAVLCCCVRRLKKLFLNVKTKKSRIIQTVK